jgi:hypothetical protein
MCSWGPQFGLWFEYIVELHAIIFFKDNCSPWYIIIVYTNHMAGEGLEMTSIIVATGTGWMEANTFPCELLVGGSQLSGFLVITLLFCSSICKWEHHWTFGRHKFIGNMAHKRTVILYFGAQVTWFFQLQRFCLNMSHRHCTNYITELQSFTIFHDFIWTCRSHHDVSVRWLYSPHFSPRKIFSVQFWTFGQGR